MTNRDRLVAVADADVHLGAADQLLACQQLIIGKHLAVTLGLGDLHFSRHRKRHGPRGHHSNAQFGCCLDQDPAATAQFVAQLIERIDHRGIRLDDTTLQLSDVILGEVGQQFGRPRRESACLQVDQVKFLFGPQRSRRHTSHPSTL